MQTNNSTGTRDGSPPTNSSTIHRGAAAIGGQLLEQHRQQLYESGLTENTTARTGHSSVDDEEEARALSNWLPGRAAPPVPLLAFPYPGIDYVRLRPDKPHIDQNKSAITYEAPVESPIRIFVPVLKLDSDDDDNTGTTRNDVPAEHSVPAPRGPEATQFGHSARSHSGRQVAR